MAKKVMLRLKTSKKTLMRFLQIKSWKILYVKGKEQSIISLICFHLILSLFSFLLCKIKKIINHFFYTLFIYFTPSFHFYLFFLFYHYHLILLSSYSRFHLSLLYDFILSKRSFLIVEGFTSVFCAISL